MFQNFIVNSVRNPARILSDGWHISFKLVEFWNYKKKPIEDNIEERIM
jgi:hypothetical protein